LRASVTDLKLSIRCLIRSLISVALMAMYASCASRRFQRDSRGRNPDHGAARKARREDEALVTAAHAVSS
jgi:hypothetical protein